MQTTVLRTQNVELGKLVIRSALAILVLLHGIAKLTGGAYLPFNSASAGALRSLLNAVATYAAGGLKALAKSKGAGAQLLLPQLKR